MRMSRKLSVHCCILAVLVILLGSISGRAADITITPILQIPLDAELKAQVSYEYEERSGFFQAAAREDGWFLLLSRSTDHSDPEKMRRVFIDIYDEHGVFQKSFQFISPAGSDDAELTDTCVNVYFYRTMLSFDLQTDAFSMYTIPDNAVQDSGLQEILTQREFDCGGWHYECRASVTWYTRLTRSNGIVEEVLFDSPEAGFHWPVWILGEACGIAVLLYYLHRRKQKAKKAKQPKRADFQIEEITGQ